MKKSLKIYACIETIMTENEDKKPNADNLEEKLAAAEKQRDEYLAGWQRAKADFINYKKEEFKRLEEIARYGNEELIKDLIVILDNFDLGLAALEKAGPVEKGIYMIRQQIEDVLTKRGLEKIVLKPGDRFNPAISEAIHEVPSDKPAGTVVEIIEAGYRMYDKILRPARVTISKSRSENPKH